MNSQPADPVTFCKLLVKKAELAYKWQHAKQECHTKYYSEDDTLTFSVVTQVNFNANVTFQCYIDACIHLHEWFLNSPLTAAQSKQQATHLLKNYSGEPGNQIQFKQYFETCLREIQLSPENHCHEAEYSIDVFFESDERIKLRKIPRLASFEMGLASTSLRRQTIGHHNNDFGYFVDTDTLSDETSAIASVAPVTQTSPAHTQQKEASSKHNKKCRRVSFFSTGSTSEMIQNQPVNCLSTLN